MPQPASGWLVTDWMLWGSAGRSLRSMLKTSRDTACSVCVCVWLLLCFLNRSSVEILFVFEHQRNQTIHTDAYRKKKVSLWQRFHKVQFMYHRHFEKYVTQRKKKTKSPAIKCSICCLKTGPYLNDYHLTNPHFIHMWCIVNSHYFPLKPRATT